MHSSVCFSTWDGFGGCREQFRPSISCGCKISNFSLSICSSMELWDGHLSSWCSWSHWPLDSEISTGRPQHPCESPKGPKPWCGLKEQVLRGHSLRLCPLPAGERARGQFWHLILQLECSLSTPNSSSSCKAWDHRRRIGSRRHISDCKHPLKQC